MDDDTDFDDGDIGDTSPAEDVTSRSDVEEAVISQKQDRGDPDPHRSDRGYLKGRNDTAVGGRYEGLEGFAATARKNGTSIQQAVKDYVGVEQMLRKDFAGGVSQIAHRFGIDPRQVAAVMHNQYFGANGNQVAASAAQQYQAHAIQRDIEEFKSDPANKHYPAVRMDMARLVQAGQATTIKQAYRLAVRNNPQLRVQEKIEKSYRRSQ